MSMVKGGESAKETNDASRKKQKDRAKNLKGEKNKYYMYMHWPRKKYTGCWRYK